MFDWGDLRFFLAAARAGSTLAASRTLKVNQTTVARRIAALESALGVRLFDRNQDGYRLSETGQKILAQAERVAAEADTLASLVAQENRALSGVVRVTAPEALANFALTPWLSEFMEIYPDIKVEVIAADRRLDLSKGEADVAVRAGRMPSEESGIVVRKLGECPWAVYCSAGYARKYGIPGRAEDLNDHFLIGAEGWLATIGPYSWVAERAPQAKVRSVCTTVINAVFAIKAGHGVGPLPCPMGASENDLVECFVLEELHYDYYLATRDTMKDVPRIRALSDFIFGRAQAQRHLLVGRRAER